MTKTIWYIHGAGASKRSFAWLRQQFPDHHASFISYDIGAPLIETVSRISEIMRHEVYPVTVIGHSLGGLIAAGVAADRNVERIVTLSSPFAGLALAGMLSLWSPERLFRDLSPFSVALADIRARYAASTVPHLALVTTNGGIPVSGEPNDGVVSVASQTAWQGPQYHMLPLNHFEVLLAEESATLIRDFVF